MYGLWTTMRVGEWVAGQRNNDSALPIFLKSPGLWSRLLKSVMKSTFLGEGSDHQRDSYKRSQSASDVCKNNYQQNARDFVFPKSFE